MSILGNCGFYCLGSQIFGNFIFLSAPAAEPTNFETSPTAAIIAFGSPDKAPATFPTVSKSGLFIPSAFVTCGNALAANPIAGKNVCLCG